MLSSCHVFHVVDMKGKKDDHVQIEIFFIFKFVCRSSSKLCALVPRESIFCDVSQALVISSILFLIFFSTYPLHYARKLEDPFNFVASMESMAIAKGLESNGIGIKSSSNSLIWSFSLAFSASMTPMKS
jgi:hypothetical protein